ncbi:Hint domain-containing protein [Roseicyclus marinus]|uniref:Hint domain-containing protein n=1 Tax=Roseicyclus marinus TaxID=2161673 RepID=UPI00240EC26F|nr:Hint domain-containing protein [Roseicyclus marinus]MDG3040168.1 Hint domain-containing protein [Roseicyclus marinus]
MVNITDNFVILTNEAWDGSSLVITQLSGNIYNFNGNDTSGTATHVAESTTGTFSDTSGNGQFSDFSAAEPAEQYTAEPGNTLPGTSGLLQFSIEVQSRVTYMDGTSDTVTLDVMVLDNNQILFDFGDAIMAGFLNQNRPIATIEVIGTEQNTYDWVNIAEHYDAYAPICYTDGAMVRTERGPRPIETLKVGDRVWTADNGFQPIRWIHARTLRASALAGDPRLRPVVITQGALGDRIPSETLRVSRQHRILIASDRVRRLFDTGEILVPALSLTRLPGVYLDDAITEVTYHHLLLDRHEILEVNGMLSESLYTGREAIRNLPQEARAELCRIFPEVFVPQRRPRKARLALEPRQARWLVAQEPPRMAAAVQLA